MLDFPEIGVPQLDDEVIEDRLARAKERSKRMRLARRRKLATTAVAVVLAIAGAGTGIVLGSSGRAVHGTADRVLRWTLVDDLTSSWRLSRVAYQGFSLTCPHTGTCYAEGVVGGKPVLEVTVDAGLHWHLVDVPAYVDPPVSCPTATTCAALGLHGPNHLVFVRSTDGGATWSSAGFPGFNPAELECRSESSCVAVAGGANGAADAFITTDGGLTWSQHPLSDATPPLRDFAPDGVSCVTATSCVVVGELSPLSGPSGGEAFSSDDGGASWSIARLPPGFEPGFDFSCPSAALCMAAGTEAGRTSLPAVAVSRDGGHTWLPEVSPASGPKSFLNWVSCASPSECLVTGGTSVTGGATHPIVAVTKDGGATWSRVALPQSTSAVGNLSCPPAAGTCYALGAERVGGRYALVFLSGGA